MAKKVRKNLVYIVNLINFASENKSGIARPLFFKIKKVYKINKK